MKKFAGLVQFWWSFLYLILLMSFWRMIFLVSQQHHLDPQAIPAYLKAFIVGLRLDAAIASYLVVPLATLLFISVLIKATAKAKKKIYYYYIYVVTVLVSLFNVIDIFYFEEINAHIDIILVKIYTTQDDSMGFIMNEYPVLLSYLVLVMMAVVLYTFYESIFKRISVRPSSWLHRMAGIGVSVVVLGTAARGGWQERPVDWGHAMFSNDFMANHVALNNIFFFGRSMVQFNSEEKIQELLNFSDPQAALQQTRELLDGSKIEFTQTHGLQRVRLNPGPGRDPNIVLVVLESHVGEFCGYINKREDSITPVLDSLARNGIAFTNCFATGKRSAYGLSSILMSWPTLPGIPLISCVSSTDRAPCIANTLRSRGYSAHFIYGGDAQFDNMRGFMTANGFDHVIERKHFRNGEKGSQWGVFDHHIFNRAITDLNQADTPLFLTLFTTTNHQPWKIPESYRERIHIPADATFNKGNVHRGMSYVDIVLGEFMEQASQTSWFENTVFIFIADHGVSVFRHHLSEIRNARIPLVVYAPGLNLNPLLLSNPVSQVDVAHIILNLIDYSEPYTFFAQDVLVDSQTVACRVSSDRAYWIENGYIYTEVLGQNAKLYETNLSDLASAREVSSTEQIDYFQKRFRSYIQTAYLQLLQNRPEDP